MNYILQDNVARVRKIQQNMTKYKHRVNLEKLGVNKFFQFSQSFKKLLQLDDESQKNSSINPDDITDINKLTNLKH